MQREKAGQREANNIHEQQQQQHEDASAKKKQGNKQERTRRKTTKRRRQSQRQRHSSRHEIERKKNTTRASVIMIQHSAVDSPWNRQTRPPSFPRVRTNITSALRTDHHANRNSKIHARIWPPPPPPPDLHTPNGPPLPAKLKTHDARMNLASPIRSRHVHSSAHLRNDAALPGPPRPPIPGRRASPRSALRASAGGKIPGTSITARFHD